jgi:hypothetical protein
LSAPLVYKEFLNKIKVKDLQEFLRNKNISTHQCKEKRELIELVLHSSQVGSQSVPQHLPFTQQQGQSFGNSNGNGGPYNVNRTSTSDGQLTEAQQTTNHTGNTAAKTSKVID